MKKRDYLGSAVFWFGFSSLTVWEVARLLGYTAGIWTALVILAIALFVLTLICRGYEDVSGWWRQEFKRAQDNAEEMLRYMARCVLLEDENKRLRDLAELNTAAHLFDEGTYESYQSAVRTLEEEVQSLKAENKQLERELFNINEAKEMEGYD